MPEPWGECFENRPSLSPHCLLWVSVLVVIYCKKKLLWWWLSEALICGYVQVSLGVDLPPFSFSENSIRFPSRHIHELSIPRFFLATWAVSGMYVFCLLKWTLKSKQSGWSFQRLCHSYTSISCRPVTAVGHRAYLSLGDIDAYLPPPVVCRASSSAVNTSQ